MKILRLKLENFGIHQNLDIGLNHAVVGLTGPNGAGKSTILAGIEYLLTGDLSDKSNTYIRHGAKKATLWMRFEKDGKEGTIQRSITPSGTRRQLDWDGEQYTRAADVQRVLDGVLCVDKAALHNALFISQGNMAGLLQGTQEERETLYAKMLLVDYLKKRGDKLDTYIREAAGDLVDLNPIIDTAEEAKEAARKVRDKLQLERNALHNPAEEQAALIELRKCSITLDEAVAAEAAAHADFRKYEAALADAMRRVETETGLKDPKTRIAELRERTIVPLATSLSSLEIEVTRLREQAAQYKDLEAVRDRVLQLELRLAELGGLPTTLPLATMVELLETLEQKQRLTEQRRELQAKYETALEEAAEFKANIKEPPPDIPAGLETEVAALHTRLTVAQTAKEKGTSVCWVCGGPLPADLVDVDTVSKAYAQKKSELDSLREAQEAYRKEVVARSTRYEYALKEAKQYKEEVEKLDAKLASDFSGIFGDIPAIRAEIEKLRKYNAAKENLLSEMQQAKTRLEELSKHLDPDNIVTQADADAKQAEVNALRTQLDAAQKEVSRLQEYVTLLEKAEASMLQADARKKDATKLAKRRATDLEYFKKNAPKRLLTRLDSASLQEVETALAEEQRAWSEKQGELVQAERELTVRREELARLLERKEREGRRAAAIEKLRAVRSMLSRDGLVLKYVQRAFDVLAEETQAILEEMDCDFSVKADPETPVHFLFTRLNSEDDSWMPQKKLSGGQAVRLSIALLLALQNVVMPDIGLLVLDEPSMHLDEEGIESLKNTLLGLQYTLSASNAQLLICDHQKDLETSYSKNIRLAG